MDWPHCTQATVSSIEPKDYPLHHAAFLNDIEWCRRLLERPDIDIAKRNVHGDTALHVATMMGHKEVIRLLLAHGAPVKIKNNCGWNPLVEAISYGNRDTITEILRALRLQARESLVERQPHLFDMLDSLGDFYLELKWDFHSWIPLLSKMLPSDVCRIYKSGCCLRMDTSLVDLNDKSWERGDISFIFNPDQDTSKQFVILDNNARTYQRIKKDTNPKDLEEEVDVLMSSDVIDMQMSTKPITFQRAKSGWIFRQEKTEEVCGYPADFYFVHNLNLVTRKRREHLSTEDIKKNKTIMQKFTTGHEVTDDELKWSQRRPDLSPPMKPDITFEEYTASLETPVLGRPPMVKTTTRSFSAVVAMSEEFPLSVSVLIDVLEVLAPFKHINKLRHFCQAKMPPGFPVKLDIPIVPTISAKVTFQRFDWRDKLNQKMFRIPIGFKEDHSRFPDF